MMLTLRRLILPSISLLLFCSISISAQTAAVSKEKELYDQIKAFSLSGGSVEVKGLVLKRDRAQMTFDGTFYLTSPTNGIVTGLYLLVMESSLRKYRPATSNETALKRWV